jgi:tetratricopeptide (TPR) repeat protein
MSYLPAHVFTNRASIYTKLKYYNNALNDYDTAFGKLKTDSEKNKLQRKIAFIRCKLGDEFYRKNEYSNAHNEYCKAIKSDRKQICYFIRRAHTRYMMRVLEKAKRDLEEASMIYESLKADTSEKTNLLSILTELNKLSLILLGKEYHHNSSMPTSLTNFQIVS